MLDSDLAELYQVNVKVLNQAVKRNIERFPQRFRFQLDENEYFNLRSQIVTLEQGRGKHRKYLPYVFTEQGVAMLSSVLRSDIAANISIQIMDAFIAMRKFLMQNASVFQRLDKLEMKMLKTDEKFEKVFKALEDGQLRPDKGIFFNGQIFDAYTFVADLIKNAKNEIILIDNYIDQ
jgi:phage regulator Rha-like protein